MIENTLLIMEVILYITSAVWLGRMLLQKFKQVKYTNKYEKALFYFGFGNILLSLVFIWLGMLGLLYKNLLFGLYLIPTLFILKRFFLSKDKAKLLGIIRGLLEKTGKNNFWILFIFLFIFFPLIPHLFLFPTGWDSVAYHLALPKIYLREHFFYFKNWFPESGYPIGIESLFGIGEVLGEPRISNFIVFVFLVLLTLYLLKGLVNKFDQNVLILGAIVFLLRSTFYTEIAVNPNVDYPFAFYGTLSGVLLFKFLESKKIENFVLMVFTLLFCGIIKYTGFILFVSVSVVLLVYFLSNRSRKLFKKMWLEFVAEKLKYLFLILIIFIPVSFWLLRNTYYTNDPVYPYFTKHFTTYEKEHQFPEITSTTKSENSYWLGAQNKMIGHIDSSLDYLFLFDNYSYYIILAVLLLFSLFAKDLFLKYLSIYCVVFVVITSYFIGPLIRYFLPVYPLISLTFAHFTIEVWKKNKLIFLPIKCFLVVFLFIQIDTAYYVRYIFFLDKPKLEQLSYFSYEKSKSKLELQNNWEAIQYLNRNIKSDEVVLSMFDNRVYYFDVNVLYGHPLAYFTGLDKRTKEESYRDLKNDNIHYVLENREWGTPALTDKGAYDTFIENYGKAVFDNKKTVIYKID